MCSSIALMCSELPPDLMERHELGRRVHDRGGREVRFDFRANPAILPVWWGGQLRIVKWGNRDRGDRRLPPTGWTWRETVEAGKWSALEPEQVDVPVTYGFANGVWFRVKQGMRALLVRSTAGDPVVYLICEPSTRYYRVMTRSDWMPVLIEEVI